MKKPYFVPTIKIVTISVRRRVCQQSIPGIILTDDSDIKADYDWVTDDYDL